LAEVLLVELHTRGQLTLDIPTVTVLKRKSCKSTIKRYTTVGKKGSTSKQGPDAKEVAAAAKRAMEKYHLKAILARVTKGTEELATVAMGESMTGVPATADMHFRNGAVAISYLGTVLLKLVDEGTVGLDDTIDRWLPKAPASDKVTLRMLANCTSGYHDFVAVAGRP
jgi:CubicO group peptidase (beta-lactamase class C family)